MRLLFVTASPRPDSASRKLTLRAKDYATRHHSDHESDLLDLRDDPIDAFRGFDAEYSTRTQQAIDMVANADALVIGSPVYNGSMSSTLKNLFEHVPYDAIKGRVAGVMLSAGGTKSFLQVRSHIEQMLTYFHVHVVPEAVYAQAEDLAHGVPDEAERRIGKLVDSVVLTAQALREVKEEKKRASQEKEAARH